MGPETPVIPSFQLLQLPLELHKVWLTSTNKHRKISFHFSTAFLIYSLLQLSFLYFRKHDSIGQYCRHNSLEHQPDRAVHQWNHTVGNALANRKGEVSYRWVGQSGVKATRNAELPVQTPPINSQKANTFQGWCHERVHRAAVAIRKLSASGTRESSLICSHNWSKKSRR